MAELYSEREQSSCYVKFLLLLIMEQPLCHIYVHAHSFHCENIATQRGRNSITFVW